MDWHARAPPLPGSQEGCLFGLTLIFLTCVAAMLFVAEEAALGPAGPREGLSVPSRPLHCCPCYARRVFYNLVLFPGCACSAALCCNPAPPPCGRAVQLQALMTFTLFHSNLVGEGLCQGVPRAEPGPEALRHYGEGVQMGSLGGSCNVLSPSLSSLPSGTGWSSNSAPGQSVSPVWWLSLGCWAGSQLLLLPPRGGKVNSCR